MKLELNIDSSELVHSKGTLLRGSNLLVPKETMVPPVLGKDVYGAAAAFFAVSNPVGQRKRCCFLCPETGKSQPSSNTKPRQLFYGQPTQNPNCVASTLFL